MGGQEAGEEVVEEERHCWMELKKAEEVGEEGPLEWRRELGWAEAGERLGWAAVAAAARTYPAGTGVEVGAPRPEVWSGEEEAGHPAQPGMEEAVEELSHVGVGVEGEGHFWVEEGEELKNKNNHRQSRK